MRIFLLLLAIGLPLAGQTAPADRQALLEARQELRSAERELRDASRRVERLRLQQVLASDEADSLSQQQLDDMRGALQEVRRQLEVVTDQLGESTDELRTSVLPKRIGQRVLQLQRDPRPMVGIIMEPSAERTGVKLRAVTPGGPADDAGLRSGDEIVAIDGEPVTSSDGVERAYELLDGMVAGDEFEFTYRRDGAEQRAAVTAREMKPEIDLDFSFSSPSIWIDGDRLQNIKTFRFPNQIGDLGQYLEWTEKQLEDEDVDIRIKRFDSLDDNHIWPFAFGWHGLQLAKLDADLGNYFGTEQGALVIAANDSIDPDLRAGDVIVSIDGQTVDEPRDAMRLLGKLRSSNQTADVTVLRDGNQQQIELSAPERHGSGYFYHFDQND